MANSISKQPGAIRAVLFDLGSTLIYFNGDWNTVIHQSDRELLRSLQANQISCADDHFAAKFRQRLMQYYIERELKHTEHTTAHILRQLLEDFGCRNVAEDTIRHALAAMYTVSQDCWQPEPDALPVLQKLKDRGYRLGLISNAADDADVQVLIDKAGIRSFFDVILTSANERIRKPNPHIFYRALDNMNISPAQAAMVGDKLDADILGAQNAGIYSIWITKRATPPEDQSLYTAIRPDTIIQSLSDLPALFKQLE